MFLLLGFQTLKLFNPCSQKTTSIWTNTHWWQIFYIAWWDQAFYLRKRIKNGKNAGLQFHPLFTKAKWKAWWKLQRRVSRKPWTIGKILAQDKNLQKSISWSWFKKCILESCLTARSESTYHKIWSSFSTMEKLEIIRSHLRWGQASKTAFIG